MIIYHVPPGETITTTAITIVNLADKHRVDVQTTFNGVTLTAHPNPTQYEKVRKIILDFYQAINQKTDESQS